VHTWDRGPDAQRSFRLDRMRSARLQREKFEPRPEFEPDELAGARTARIWYSKQIARWKVEEGAQPLKDGTALSERPVGSEEWLVGEILSDRGEAVVLEPEDLRKRVARRAKELVKELRVGRVPAKA
jgi:proteasome accessory factor BC